MISATIRWYLEAPLEEAGLRANYPTNEQVNKYCISARTKRKYSIDKRELLTYLLIPKMPMIQYGDANYVKSSSTKK